MTEWEVVAVKADAPWKNGKEFFDALKKDPANMHIGVGPALGNNDHIQFLALAKRYGADPKAVKFVVYPNTAAEQIPALLGGHIKAITISLARRWSRSRSASSACSALLRRARRSRSRCSHLEGTGHRLRLSALAR
jgi:tripartite-type tricarboxylate transporter receptor subunit TctC